MAYLQSYSLSFLFKRLSVSNLHWRTLAFNTFLANVSILYPLKTPENLRFSGFFRGYKMRTLARKRLMKRFTRNKIRTNTSSIGEAKFRGVNFTFNRANLSKLINFYPPWNHQKTVDFPMISRRIEFNYSLNIRSDDISITPYIRLVLGRDPLTSLRISNTIAISLS